MRSIVGLLPLAAVAVFEEDILAKLPTFRERAQLFNGRHPELAANMHLPTQPGVANRRMLSIVNEEKLRRILARMLDESEFFGPHGIRALSRFHLEHPYVFTTAGTSIGWPTCRAIRTRACSAAIPTGVGPVWMPINFLLYTSLVRLYAYYGEDFKVECPTGSGQMMTLLRGGTGTGRASDAASSCATRPASGRWTVAATSFATIRTGAIWCSSTNTFMATPGRESAPATRPAGPAACARSSKTNADIHQGTAAGARSGGGGLPGLRPRRRAAKPNSTGMKS